MIIFIYSVIIFTATFLGALVGLGGGVIIKPLLDVIGQDSIDVVNFISTCAVFSMSISSSVKHIRAKTEIDFRRMISISVGAVIGGICGLIFAFSIYRKMQRTNDEVIAQINDLTKPEE